MSTVEASVFKNPSSLVDQIVLNADGTLGGELASTFMPIAGGKILQIVRATDSTNRTTTSASFVDVTGMSVTITPQKSNSAILLLASVLVRIDQSGDSTESDLQITDNSNNALSGAQAVRIGLFGYTGSGTRVFQVQQTLTAWSTPATTSATTYKLRFKSSGSDITTRIQNAAATGQMYAIEVSV
jgi:hypothetical protein